MVLLYNTNLAVNLRLNWVTILLYGTNLAVNLRKNLQQEALWLFILAFYTTGHPVYEIGVHRKCLRMWLLSLNFIEPFLERVSLYM